MAAVYDNSIATGSFSVGVTSVTTPSFTITSSANRAAMVCLAVNLNTVTVSAMHCGGVTGAAITGADTGTGKNIRVVCWGVTAPASGSQTADASWNTSTTAALGVVTASGVDQTTPLNHGNAATSATASVSVSITSASGDLTATAAYTNDAWTGGFTNQTLKWSVGTGVSYSGDVGPGTGTTTHTWTDQFSGQQLTCAGANFVASGGGGSASITPIVDTRTLTGIASSPVIGNVLQPTTP